MLAHTPCHTSLNTAVELCEQVLVGCGFSRPLLDYGYDSAACKRCLLWSAPKTTKFPPTPEVVEARLGLAWPGIDG